MSITGIICEYNPLHTGHVKQLRFLRRHSGADGGIVCLMSGNFVQRGAPAIIDKSLRAKAAVLCGADLVLELPLGVCLSSAEGFAGGGVQILSPFCDALCFGAETADEASLSALARTLLSEEFPDALRAALASGCSFPAARQRALEAMGLNAAPLSLPNNLLAVEYYKAIYRTGSAMRPMPILRQGGYHDRQLDPENPSAAALRQRMLAGQDCALALPEAARACFSGAPLHTTDAGQRAVLAHLRAMEEADFAALPFGSEGLWRKLMHAVRENATLDAVIAAVKSKRYPMTRINRMVMCAFLGLDRAFLETPAPYVRALAFNDRGREILKKARRTGVFRNAGEPDASDYWARERQADDLYGLFAVEAPEAPGRESRRRVYCHRL